MASTNRFCDQPITTVSLKSAFSGEFEGTRMSHIRPSIAEIRRRWLTNDGYVSLVNQVRTLCVQDSLSSVARAALDRLFEGYRDYADIHLQRPVPPVADRFDAVEFYCSDEGYQYVKRVIQEVFRKDNPTLDQLVRATTFVEWITIDLYNLRLSQIGDPRYENFEGVVYRWMILEPAHVDEYRQILQRPDHTKRNFAIPLGFASTATDLDTTAHFAAIKQPHAGGIRVLQKIHIHGMNPALLAAYKHRYPESVVTSICAMPVARLSPFGEKEILLRGPFYHLIATLDREDDRGSFVELVAVSMNSSRDHGSEDSSNDGHKATQRSAFLAAVSASKWEVCASIAADYSTTDASAYEQLQANMLQTLNQRLEVDLQLGGQLAETRSMEIGVWLGGFLARSYPYHYAARRKEWQVALATGNWVHAENIIGNEYSWRRSEWYNVGKLFDDNEAVQGDNLTLLHELIRQAPPASLMQEIDDENYRAWKRLVEGVDDEHVWKSIRSFDASSQTAQEMASDRGLCLLAERLRPRILRPVPKAVLDDLQQQLHALITEKTLSFIDCAHFHLPQLSVLTEMLCPELWIPIPRMFGGFLIKLDGHNLNVVIFETEAGHSSRTQIRLRMRCPTKGGANQLFRPTTEIGHCDMI